MRSHLQRECGLLACLQKQKSTFKLKQTRTNEIDAHTGIDTHVYARTLVMPIICHTVLIVYRSVLMMMMIAIFSCATLHKDFNYINGVPCKWVCVCVTCATCTITLKYYNSVAPSKIGWDRNGQLFDFFWRSYSMTHFCMFKCACVQFGVLCSCVCTFVHIPNDSCYGAFLPTKHRHCLCNTIM